MSLTSALRIGNSALSASQLAIQVTANNLANLATPGYTRQSVELAPTPGQTSGPGSGVGRGVGVVGVRREIDEALEERLRQAVSSQASAERRLSLLSQIEDALGELGESDLSSQLGSFFSSWSERANLTQSSAAVVQQGVSLASTMSRVRSDLVSQRAQLDREVTGLVTRADELLSEIAELNRQVIEAESNGETAPALRDRRDTSLQKLSQIIDITVYEESSGAANVLTDSEPLVLGGRTRGLALRQREENGRTILEAVVRSEDRAVSLRGGTLATLLSERAGAIDATVDSLDQLASELIFQVNRLHATGGQEGLTQVTGTLKFAVSDQGVALNSPANFSLSDLPFAASNGGFLVHVRDAGTNSLRSVRIDVDLDGLTNGGAEGVGDDTTLQDILNAIGAVPGLDAGVTADGRVRITAQPGVSFSFGDDTSGVLALLGVNSYFTGKDASDIGVNTDLQANPTRLGVARRSGSATTENGTALAIAALRDQPLEALGGQTLIENWSAAVQQTGVRVESARTTADAAGIVREALEAQRAGVSGVSADEETINLLMYQRTYQGAARLISIVDELTRTIISLV